MDIVHRVNHTWVGALRLDAIRLGKKWLKSSRDEGTSRSEQGGGRRACYVIPDLSCDQEGERKEGQI